MVKMKNKEKILEFIEEYFGRRFSRFLIFIIFLWLFHASSQVPTSNCLELWLKFQTLIIESFGIVWLIDRWLK